LKRIFYEQFKSSGKLVIIWKHIFLNPAENTFSQFGKHKIGEGALDGGLIRGKVQGLFSKSYPEGVTSNPERRS